MVHSCASDAFHCNGAYPSMGPNSNIIHLIPADPTDVTVALHQEDCV